MSMVARTLSKACWPLGLLSVKRSVNCDPLSVSSLMILIGEASLSHLAAVARVILKTLAASRSDRPESLISYRIFVWFGLGGEGVSSWTDVYAMCCNRWADLGGKPPINSSSTVLALNRAMLR